MKSKHSVRLYRRWYARLLRLYSRSHYQRFGEEMEQTFNDLLQERARAERGLLGCALRMYLETSAEIIKEHRRLAMNNKSIIRVALATAFILLIPLVAMQFTNEVDWGPLDFAVAGGLLFGAGLTFTLVARKGKNSAYRVAVGIAVATGLILIWSNLAVGIIGSEDNPANLMYNAVLAVGCIGAFLARLQSPGMARTLFAMALIQSLITAIALVARMDRLPGASAVEIVNVNAFFIFLWVGAALLFRKAHAAAVHPKQLVE